MSTLKTNTLSNVAGTASTAIENAINGSAKAWVNFNGTGTVAIRASYNVSSITDNGTGNYTINFTTALPDGSYVINGTHSGGGNGGSSTIIASQSLGGAAPSTTSFIVGTIHPSGVSIDPSIMCLSIFR
jgi:hypothetical protein